MSNFSSREAACVLGLREAGPIDGRPDAGLHRAIWRDFAEMSTGHVYFANARSCAEFKRQRFACCGGEMPAHNSSRSLVVAFVNLKTFHIHECVVHMHAFVTCSPYCVCPPRVQLASGNDCPVLALGSVLDINSRTPIKWFAFQSRCLLYM